MRDPGYCEIANQDCINPAGYQVGGLGGPSGPNPEGERTRVICTDCGVYVCAKCRGKRGGKWICDGCLPRHPVTINRGSGRFTPPKKFEPKVLQLTEAEAEIVRLLVIDFSEPAIAKRQGRGARTINQHVRRAMARNRVVSRLALIRRFEEAGHEVIDGRSR
jgi:DNA-binding CsgD family transcriptional regulator